MDRWIERYRLVPFSTSRLHPPLDYKSRGGWMDGWLSYPLDGWMDGLSYPLDGWMDGLSYPLDGWVDGLSYPLDGWMDGLSYPLHNNMPF